MRLSITLLPSLTFRGSSEVNGTILGCQPRGVKRGIVSEITWRPGWRGRAVKDTGTEGGLSLGYGECLSDPLGSGGRGVESFVSWLARSEDDQRRVREMLQLSGRTPLVTSVLGRCGT